MASKRSNPGKIHLRIVEVMKRYPGGITGGQIRQELEKEGLRPEDQTHLDKRKRELKSWYLIGKRRSVALVEGKKRSLFLYTYEGEKEIVTDQGSVSQKLRARIIGAAHGRCQMCGKTIEKHGITLVADHKRPRDWGGTNDPQNLWAICEECNGGKKAHFSSLNADEVMKKVISHRSVHVRIGELLKAVGIGNRTSSELLEVAADQDDWQKRLRELRYSVIGWEIDKKLYKSPSGKKQADYILRSYKPWPEDPSGTIRRFEQDRKHINRTRKSDQ